MPYREFEKNSRENIRVTARRYEGHDLIDIRVYSKGNSDDAIPTKKGVALNVDAIPELIDALVWALGQPCDDGESTDDSKLLENDADRLAEGAWKILVQHGSAVHWDTAERIVLSQIPGFSKWNLHYVLATRSNLFRRIGAANFQARKKSCG